MSKVGLDDFLVVQGIEALQKLLEEAQEPQEPAGTPGGAGLDLNDAGMADRLVDKHGPDLLHVHECGWMHYDHQRWTGDKTGEVARRV